MVKGWSKNSEVIAFTEAQWDALQPHNVKRCYDYLMGKYTPLKPPPTTAALAPLPPLPTTTTVTTVLSTADVSAVSSLSETMVTPLQVLHLNSNTAPSLSKKSEEYRSFTEPYVNKASNITSSCICTTHSQIVRTPPCPIACILQWLQHKVSHCTPNYVKQKSSCTNILRGTTSYTL